VGIAAGSKPPPYRIETERLVLRCSEPRDAPLLKDAIDSSLDHLRPWMPWAEAEPQTLEEKIALLRRFRGNFDLGEDFVYGIFAPDESRVLGGTGLHRRVGDDAFEIGYFIRADSTRQGLATESTAALTRVAFDVCGVDRVEIHVEPANEASRRVPGKLGFVEEATLRRRLPSRAGEARRDVVVFTMLVEEFAASPCASVEYRAFDAAGRSIDAGRTGRRSSRR
jgi:RimJ/RimL family protein N-acetyltransferase